MNTRNKNRKKKTPKPSNTHTYIKNFAHTHITYPYVLHLLKRINKLIFHEL